MHYDLQTAVAVAISNGWQLVSIDNNTNTALMVAAPKSLVMFHVINILLSMATLGLWLIPYLIMCIPVYRDRRNRQTIVVYPDGHYDTIYAGRR